MAEPLNTGPLRRNTWRSRVAGGLMALLVAACGGSDPEGSAPPADAQPSTMTGADGARIDFTPAEGLPPAKLSITRAEAGAPALPADVVAAGPVYQFAPHGHVGTAIEIRVPFKPSQADGGTPRLLVALPGDSGWSEVEAEPEGATLRARVPALGYAVAVRPLGESTARRASASATQPTQTLRGQLSAEPPLQGSAFVRSATAPSTLTVALDYAFARTCAAPVQLRLRALVVRPPTSTQLLSVVTLELGSRALTNRTGSERFDLPLTAARNGTWAFLAEARCVEQGRVRFALLATLPVLVVKIPAPPPPSPTEGSATIGSAGGVVNGPDGVQLVVPEGALAETVTIRIARSAAGAPPLPEGLPPAVTVYEITPHDLRFGQPVTVRLPFTGTVSPGQVAFVATPGGNWLTVPATVANGFVEIRRSSLSWYGHNYGRDCLIPLNDPDPLRCPFATIGTGGDITTNPPGAITPVPRGNGFLEITRAATLTIPVAVSAPADCSNGQVTVVRRIWNRVGPQAPAQQILQQPLNLVPGPGFSGNIVGSFTLQTAVTAADNGTIDLEFFFQCTRAFRGQGSGAFAGVGYGVRIEPPVGAPTITQQPANVAVTAGTTARFSVLANATNGLSVTWERSIDAGVSWQAQGAGIGIAGGSALDISTQLADNGARFRARVCNGSGPTQTCLDSSSATLTVIQATLAPVFTTQPVSSSVVAGQSASFTAVAVGRPAPSIRWQAAPAGTTSFADVAGEAGCAPTAAPGSGELTSSTCTISQTDVGRSGLRLQALAINAAAAGGVASDVVTLTVDPAPVPAGITQQPSPQSTDLLGSATFTVGAVGTARLNFTWRINGVDLPSPANDFAIGSCTGNFSPGPGGTGTFSRVSFGCNGLPVTVYVSNGIGPGATSNPATLTVVQPVIPPVSQSVDIGQTATFTVQAQGTALAYQWQRARGQGIDLNTGEIENASFEDIPGATSSSFTTPPATISDDLSLFAVRVCGGAAQPPSFPNCSFYGKFFDRIRLRINEVVSQNFGTVASGTSSNLNAVAFSTSLIGVAVGDGGTILRTTDAGQTWAPIASGTVGQLRAVAFGGAGLGVIAGASGLLFTADAGATWTAARPGDNGVCCRDVAYAGATTAVATYRDGFLSSTNGGQFFVPSFSTPLLATNVVRFGSASNGAAVYLASFLYTTDGGVTWLAATQTPNLFANTLAFASSSIAVATDGARLLRTTNGGQTWTSLYGGGLTRYANALAFNGAGVGLALQGPVFGAMRTADFGQTWVPLALPGFTGSINGLTFADANVVIAVGPGGTILRFTAAGL